MPTSISRRRIRGLARRHRAEQVHQQNRQDALADAWQRGFWAGVTRGPHATRNPYDPTRVGPRTHKEAR